MDAFPRVRVKYTSSTHSGQIYFGAINYILAIAVLGTIAGFGTEYALTNAYGFAVSTGKCYVEPLKKRQLMFKKS